eukprot:g2630.t1
MRVDGDTVRRRRLKPGLTTDPGYLREHYNYQGECKSASKIYVLGLSDADKFSPDDFSRFGEKFHHTVSLPIMLANKTINDYSTCEKNPEYCLNLNAVTQYISTGGPGCQIVFSRGSFGLTNLAGHSALETFVHSVAHLLSTSSLQKAVVVVPYVISTILQNANVRDTIANLILDLTANGFTLVVTAGNEGAIGADGNCTSFDASLLASPYTVVVGSTSWSPVSYPSKKSTEVVGMCGNLDQYSVSSTGGGFAEFYDNANLTAWQTKHKEKYFSLVGDHLPVASAYDANGRGFPDISFLGDLYTVVLNEETTFSGGSGPPAAFFGGVLAMIHDLNAEQGGNPIPAWFTPTLYDIYDNNPSAFYDIDVGTNKCGQMLNNGTCPSCVCPNGAAGWRSEKGWDPASGLGSMNVSALFEALNVSMYKGRENYSPLLSTRQLAVVMALILIISTICILVVYGIVVRNDDRAKYEEALLTELSHDEEYESEDDDDARRGHGRLPPNWDEPLSWSDEEPYYYAPNAYPQCDEWPHSYACPNNASYETFSDWMDMNRTRDQIRKYANAKQPFFLTFGAHRPHLPWNVPTKFWDMYGPTENVSLPVYESAPRDMPSIAFTYECDGKTEVIALDDTAPIPYPSASTALPPNMTKTLRRGYFSSVSWTDYLIGELLTELDKSGVANETIVVLIGDHGWQLGEHNIWGKHTNFELGTRVPLIIADPEIAPFVSDALVESVDVYPTIAALAGIPNPPDLDGVDLTPLMEKSRAKIKDAVFSEYPRCPPNVSAPWGDTTSCVQTPRENFTAMGYSVRTMEWRYTVWLYWDGEHLKGDFGRSPIGVELYKHKGDSGADFDAFENVNLAGDPAYKDVRNQLYEIAESHWKSGGWAHIPRARPRVIEESDEERRLRLELWDMADDGRIP